VPLGDDFIVNLDGLAHFAKFAVSPQGRQGPRSSRLRPSAATTGDSTLDDQAQIRDIVIADTSSYTASQLASMSGKQKLKSAIMTDVAKRDEHGRARCLLHGIRDPMSDDNRHAAGHHGGRRRRGA